MRATLPHVQSDTLRIASSDGDIALTVGSPEWFAWLEHAHRFTFSSPAGSFTARREHASNMRGGWYWKAYRRSDGTLRTVYLGKSGALTLEHLLSAAEDLAIVPGPRGESRRAHAVHRSSTLPVPLTSLIGREADVVRILSRLREPEMRVLTLAGPGGVGKTRLAVEVAARAGDFFRDGVIFVPLAAVTEAAEVPTAITRACGLQAPDRLHAFLRKKRTLLVLDNFEHLRQCAPQLEALLSAAPHINVLLTSRVVTRMAGERIVRVAPLSLPERARALADVRGSAAVALFVERARAVAEDFALTEENAHTIAAVCARLDGLPLAIELAATRIALLTPDELLDHLSSSIHTLPDAPSRGAGHQRSLRETLRWSYDLLSPEEQRLLRAVSVFVGDFAPGAASDLMRRMGWDHGDVMPLLATLQEHSLLYRAAREGHESRLAMLELVREYARERLSEAGETEMVSSAHAVHFLTLAEEAARYLRGTSQQGRWMERLDRERENLRAALRWFMRQGDGNAMVRYCAGLWWYWVTRGELREGFKVTGNALAHSQSVTRAWAVTLLAHGSFALRLGRFTLATGVLEQSAEMFATLDDTAGRAEALLTLGLARGQAGDMLHGRPLVEESYRQARTLGDAWLIGYALDTLARLAWQVGDLVETRRLALEGLRIAGDVGEFRAHVSPRKLLASAALAEGMWDEARTLGSELFAIARRISDRESEFHALLTLGTAHYAQEDFLPAERSFRAAARLARASGHERNLSQALARLGDTALAQGNEALALRRYRQSIRLAVSSEDQVAAGWALLGLARLTHEHDTRHAAMLLGAAHVRLQVGRDLDAAARSTWERTFATVRERLGESAFTKAFAAGHLMPLADTLAGRRPATTSARSAANALTTREIEVLRLVALGWTDAEVARSLVVSPRTVHGHLRSIYGKLDVRSRTAAARYATEHGLL